LASFIKNMPKVHKLAIAVILPCYLVFLYMDLGGSNLNHVNSASIKYLSVFLCFINVLLIGKKGHDKTDTVLLQFAMLLTICADFLLLFTNNFVQGIALFCLIQTTYIVRHSRFSRFNFKAYAVTGFIFIALSSALGVLSVISGNMIFCLGTLYAFLSVCSIVTAFSLLKYRLYPDKTCIYIICGLCLLFLCDINVALCNVYLNGGGMTGFLMWFFYLPSQLLLSMSGMKDQ